MKVGTNPVAGTSPICGLCPGPDPGPPLRFLQDLEQRLEANVLRFSVCDVVLQHCPAFRRVYLPYVTNQAYQERTYQRLL